jgi:hypothetical protein
MDREQKQIIKHFALLILGVPIACFLIIFGAITCSGAL